MIVKQLPPHSVETEQALIGSLLIDPSAILDIDEIISPEHFYSGRNKTVFEAIHSLYSENKAIDFVTVVTALNKAGKLAEVGGEAGVLDLMTAVPTSVNAEFYAREVSEKATRRRMIQVAGKIASTAYDESGNIDQQLADTEMQVLSLRGDRIHDKLAKPRKYTSDFVDVLADAMAQDSPLLGVPSGFVDLDKKLLGFLKGNLYIVAARPGMGKSSFLVDIARHMTLNLNKRVVLFTMEMSTNQVTARLVAGETGIPLTRIRTGKLNSEQASLVYETVGRISESHLFIDTTANLTPAKLNSKVKRLYAEYGIDAVFVDYLGLMCPDRERGTKTNEVGDISRSLKVLAGDLEIPVIAAHQLSRAVEHRGIKKPQLSDLRDSGNIEQDAFSVMFLYRDEYYNPDLTEKPNTCEVGIAKHRDGETGDVDLYWMGKCASFKNLDCRTKGVWT